MRVVTISAMRVLRRVAGEFRGAPLTFGWLTLLLGTTVLQHRLAPATLQRLLEADSTSLQNLGHDPIRVMLGSLLWIDGAQWLPYVVFFVLISARVERWLGSWRWLAIGLLGHVLATLLSEGYLRLEIQAGIAPPSMERTMDIGVSYFLATLAGVLAYRLHGASRWVYLAGMLGLIGLISSGQFDFTTLGHLCSLGIGLVCYPMVAQVVRRPAPAPLAVREEAASEARL